MSMVLLVACGILGLVVVGGLLVGIVLIMLSGKQDGVSAARQGWMDSGRDRES